VAGSYGSLSLALALLGVGCSSPALSCLSHDGCPLSARNVSSERSEARRKLRECDGLVDALIYVVQSEIGQKDLDSKVPQRGYCWGMCRALPLTASSSSVLLFVVAEAGFIPRRMKNESGDLQQGEI